MERIEQAKDTLKAVLTPPPQTPPAYQMGRYPTRPMHYDAHQPVIDDLEARILTIRDSL